MAEFEASQGYTVRPSVVERLPNYNVPRASSLAPPKPKQQTREGILEVTVCTMILLVSLFDQVFLYCK